MRCNAPVFLLAAAVTTIVGSWMILTVAAKKDVPADDAEVNRCNQYAASHKGNVGKKDRPAEAQNLLCQRPSNWKRGVKEAKARGESGRPKQSKKQNDYIQAYIDCKGKKTCHNLVKRNAELRGKRQTTTPPRVQRQEYRCMSDVDRNRYHSCVKALNTTLIDGKSQYQILAAYHTFAAAPGAHGGHSFPPWHREYLKVYQLMMQEHDPLCSLPYFDSTLDEIIPVPGDSIIWTANFLGNAVGYVTTGPFANWPTPVSDSDCGTQKKLCRRLDPQAGQYYYYNPAIHDFVLTRSGFEDFSYCKDTTFEVEHGGVHVAIGGHMSLINTAPNDPAFYMHHCYIDYMWEEFRQKVQDPAGRETDYPETCDCSSQCNPQDEMQPMGPKKNIDGLSNSYINDFYYYQDRPVCNAALTDCVPSSPYLFCDTKSKRCLTKIRAGGSCTGFTNQKICYNSACKLVKRKYVCG